MKVLFWGTGDTGKPRTRILLSSMRMAGVEISDIHKEIWSGIEDKSQLGHLGRLQRYARWLGAYPRLLWRLVSSDKPDAIFLAYPAQIDVLLVWPVARARRIPVVMDLFISIYDTTVLDRKMSRPRSLKARVIRRLEWLACRAADHVLIDTEPHARYIEELFGLSQGRVGHVPVGAELEDFPPHPAATPGARPRIVFYGQLIPLHGIDAVLDAALSERGRAYDWHIIGSGQDTPKLEARLGQGADDHVTWTRWLPYRDLSDEIGRADICLGIFGDSRKAASVVPNKVYQCLASARHVVTRSSPAMDAFAPGGDPGLTLVAPGSPDALLDGIESALAAGALPPSPGLVESFTPAAIGQQLLMQIETARN